MNESPVTSQVLQIGAYNKEAEQVPSFLLPLSRQDEEGRLAAEQMTRACFELHGRRIYARLFLIPVMYDTFAIPNGQLHSRFEGAPALLAAMRKEAGTAAVRLVNHVYTYAEVVNWSGEEVRGLMAALVRDRPDSLPARDPEMRIEADGNVGSISFLAGIVASQDENLELPQRNWDRCRQIAEASMAMQTMTDRHLIRPKVGRPCDFRAAVCVGAEEIVRQLVLHYKRESSNGIKVDFHHLSGTSVELVIGIDGDETGCALDVGLHGLDGLARILQSAYDACGNALKKRHLH